MPFTTLVLLPGLEGTGVLFRPLAEQLPREIEPLIVSYPPQEALGYAELLDRVIMPVLPQDRPFVILGESFSGPLSLMVAARHPLGLRGVILCGTFVTNPLGKRLRWLRHFVFPFAFRLFPMMAQTKALLGGYSSPKLRTLLSEAHASVSPAVFAYRAKAVLQVDVREELRQCPVPILDLRGTRDNVVRRHNAREVQSLCPTACVVELRAPHLIVQTQPEEAATAIAKFIHDVTKREIVP